MYVCMNECMYVCKCQALPNSIFKIVKPPKVEPLLFGNFYLFYLFQNLYFQVKVFLCFGNLSYLSIFSFLASLFFSMNVCMNVER